MLPVLDHFSLISSQYLGRVLKPTNASHSVVTSPSGIRNMKQPLQSRLLYCVALYLSSGILPLTDYGITIKSLHTKAVSDFQYLISHNRVLQSASPQIAQEEANLLSLYRTTLTQLRSSFCSSFQSYRKRIGLIPSLPRPFCGVEPHNTIHVFSCSSHLTPLTELDL